MATWGGNAYGQSTDAGDKPRKSAALQRARDAWNNGDFDIAPGLFLDAIAAGGLQKADVVDAYARIGAALTMAHKTQTALTVFHNTALLDPGFKVPPEAGKKVIALAERARREQARIGSLTIAAQVADEVDTASAVPIDVSVAPPHASSLGMATKRSPSSRPKRRSLSSEGATRDSRSTSSSATWACPECRAGSSHF